jgi:transcriptional regulator with XRE-family HTH domain
LLRESREQEGLSQHQFAALLKKPQSYVSKVELAERQMNIVELKEWCDTLGVDTLDFIKTWLAMLATPTRLD